VLAALAAPTLAGLAACDSDDAEREFPSRPVRVIVPFAPGGSSDTLARVFKKAIDDEELPGAPLVIVNVGGAGGTIGSRRVMNATPDGHTILFLHQAILTAKHSGKALYGPEAFEPIAATGESRMVVATSMTSEIRDLPDALERSRRKPESLAFGANLGAPSHFVARQLEASAEGAAFRYVQTGGGAKRFAALQGGHIDLTAFSVDELIRFRAAGVRAIALLSAERDPDLPDVPTAREQNVDVISSNLNFWWAPKGTSPDRVAILAAVLRRALECEYVQSKLEESHCEPVWLDGEELTTRLDRLEADFASVPSGAASDLPDLPSALAIVTAALLVLVLGQTVHRRARSKAHSRKERLFGPTLNFVGLVIAYLVVLAAFEIPFAVPTAIFVFGCVALLRGLHRDRVAPIVVPILFAIVIQLLFETLLSIELP